MYDNYIIERMNQAAEFRSRFELMERGSRDKVRQFYDQLKTILPHLNMHAVTLTKLKLYDDNRLDITVEHNGKPLWCMIVVGEADVTSDGMTFHLASATSWTDGDAPTDVPANTQRKTEKELIEQIVLQHALIAHDFTEQKLSRWAKAKGDEDSGYGTSTWSFGR